MQRLHEESAEGSDSFDNMLIKFGSSDLDDKLHGLMMAGAGAAAHTAWVEVNRPLTALALNRDPVEQLKHPTPSGGVLALSVVSFPVGMDVKSIVCVPSDIDNWLALNFTLGTMNLINPQGSYGGSNLSPFHPLAPHEDKIAPWILSKTKVDVQVTAQLVNVAYRYGDVRDLPAAPLSAPARKPRVIKPPRLRKKVSDSPPVPARLNSLPDMPLPVSLSAGRGVEAIFHGFSILAFQEEQVCAIQTRIEPADRMIGCAELINHFRRALADADNRQNVRYAQAKDPVQVKVARVVAAAGNLSESVKSLFTGRVVPPPAGHPSHVSYPQGGIGPASFPYQGGR